MELPVNSHRRGLWILSPLLVFFLVYVVASLFAGDFYKMPVTVAFLAACAWAFVVSKPKPLNRLIDRFSAGAGNTNIMMMVWIFILAGAFTGSAKFIGSVAATVNMTLSVLPPNMLPAGLFLASCLISLAIGTSVGAIVALMPVASALAVSADLPLPMVAGIVVGGAFFGDNLSFISDTTIAATRTQGCLMKDKFRANFRLVLPAALLVLVIYIAFGCQYDGAVHADAYEFSKVIPYLIVLITAICGLNVMLVLIVGLFATSISVMCSPELQMIDWAAAMGKGMTDMGELIIVTLMAGGLLELIRYNGGLQYIISHLTAKIRSTRAAQFTISLLVAFANLCTANNTVAIVAVGDIARCVAERFNISAPRAASLLDTTSCIVQGVLPYGAQLLMGASLAGIATLDIIPFLFYNYALAVACLLFIIFKRN
ncbi:MAG: Na+/H+ antiporter NhaC family protein [Akkermansia sp.]|nr:Na+/H+ antiporter NhaC family protein [Akkermansia sp.]